MPIFSTQLDELKTEVTGALGQLGRVGEDNKTLLEKRLAEARKIDPSAGEEKPKGGAANASSEG